MADKIAALAQAKQTVGPLHQILRRRLHQLELTRLEQGAGARAGASGAAA